jgi:tRNA pseudouridine55 synthase
LDRIINIYKPVGWTSFDVVRRIKHRWPLEKVGHAGTLDPFAEGVLLVCVGKATKQVSGLMDSPKEYRAVVQLGYETDTLDITGRIVRKKKPALMNENNASEILQRFVGTIDQIPPKYSALKQNGQRMYHLMRVGTEVEPASRPVIIFELELLEFLTPDRLEIRILCSKGTFVRSLARDLAYALNTAGYLRSLVRTRIGAYTVDQAHRMDRPDTW